MKEFTKQPRCEKCDGGNIHMTWVGPLMAKELSMGPEYLMCVCGRCKFKFSMKIKPITVEKSDFKKWKPQELEQTQ